MSADSGDQNSYVLGLDLGVGSIGWSCVRLDDSGSGSGLIDTGVHLFESGVGVGQRADESPAKNRRDARSLRRQTWRRRHRRRKVAKILQGYGLLPQGSLASSTDIDAFFKRLDSELYLRWEDRVPPQQRDRLMYTIRAHAAKCRVETDEFGRAIYHLAQRRGFLSNRKTQRKDDDEGVVTAGISELQSLIDKSGEPTLGAYLATIDPHERRIRDRYTHRTMYKREFDVLWSEQSKHHAILTEELRTELFSALFDQRPLKDQSHLIGACSLVKGRRRAPKAERSYQRFRLLQTVNHLRIETPDQEPRLLDTEERTKLIRFLTREGDRTFTQVRSKKILGLSRDTEFSLAEQVDEGSDKKLIGHRTDAKIRAVLGERFDELNEADKDAIVHDLRSIRESDALIRRAMKRWGLARGQAQQLADIHLEEGYARLSLEAIERLLPLLEQGASYSQARKEIFPDSFKATTTLEALPPVDQAIDNLTNPSVHRAITELRKVVNAIIRKHGKPSKIHVELARELKHGKSRRERVERRIKEREKTRASIVEQIIRESAERGFPIAEPRRSDVEKVLLAEECGWICPYTGREMSWETLLGPHAQFDIEHIWPFSRSLDNSFRNKTLCHSEENRRIKRRHTPFEAYGLVSDKWGSILARVNRFKGDSFIKREKLRRFEAESIDDGFTNRHLNETGYIAREASEYLGLLFGGQVDASGVRRVQTSTGGATYWVRRELGLNTILGSTGDKNRADHRHHAIDALVVALLMPSMIQQLARASSEAEEQGSGRLFLSLDRDPWDGFRQDVEAAVDEIHVSHRQSRKVSGALHKESIYSKPIHGGHRIRKRLSDLSPADVNSNSKIVDQRARMLIRQRLAEMAGPHFRKTDIVKVFSDVSNLPTVHGPGGRLVAIRHVRLAVDDHPRSFGSSANQRFANTGSNHHCTAHRRESASGKPEWKYTICTVAEAYQRILDKKPVVQREAGDGWVFDFSLVKNEFVEMDDVHGKRQLYRLRSISVQSSGSPDLEFALHTDAVADRSTKVRISSMKALWARHPRKVHVSYIGAIHDAGG